MMVSFTFTIKLGGRELRRPDPLLRPKNASSLTPFCSFSFLFFSQFLKVSAGLKHLSGAPIMVGERCIGMLTIGFDKLEGRQNFGIWPTYMNLVASSLVSMIKDNSIPKYVHMALEIHEAADLDLLMHSVIQQIRHVNPNPEPMPPCRPVRSMRTQAREIHEAADLDLLMHSAREIHEAADLDLLMHSVIQQFRIVLGHTNNQHVWYRCALTSFTTLTATIFDDLTQRGGDNAGSLNNSINSSGSYKLLKDVQAAGGIMRSCVNLKSTVMKISIHNRQQVMIPDVQKLINQSGNVSADIFNTRLIKPPTAVLVFPLKVQQHIFGAVFCMSSVQTDFADVAPRVREMCEVLAPHVLLILNGKMKDEYQAMQAASSNPVDSIHMSFSKDMSMGLNSSGIGIGNSDGNFVFAQSRSSTGALVTGLTEKLNQKRIKSSMEFNGNNELLELQINHLLGEGGFAKVFRGLWRGLVVGVKVVCDDGKNEKMVVKNAHEIAILTAISHPNVVQAYTCMTDIMVRDMCTVCMRNATQQVIIEYCDLGNLSTALKSHVFHQRGDDCKLLDLLANAASRGMPDLFTPESANPGVDPVINMTSLTLTLIEIASAMGELHKMGVVHCDLKPANVLLKSSNNDPRGFTAKVSDFGLSRVEDDDSAASFPFNSCGTAAYVAPEALISNKKVTSSVDVYAFGILMCEMHMAQRPYGNMKQQQLVEEVVMWGIRPKFNGSAPQEYVALSQACWNGLPTSRPTFDEVVATLSMMLESNTTSNTVRPPSASSRQELGGFTPLFSPGHT
eukprot:gene5663-8988_t